MSYLYEHMQQDDSPFLAVVKNAAGGASPVKPVGDKTPKTKLPKKKRSKSGLPDNLNEGYEALTAGPMRVGTRELAKNASMKKIITGTLGLGGAGAGGGAYYMSRPYEGDPDVSRWSLWRTRRALNKALKNLYKGDSDLKVDTGLHRQVIPLHKINENALKHLGYEPSIVAIPERGQTQFTSYRKAPDPSRPDYNPHIHKHKKNWLLHSDKHPSLTMALKHAKTPEEVIAAVPSGIRHVVGEGVPGAFAYLINLIMDNPTFEERVDKGWVDYMDNYDPQMIAEEMAKSSAAKPYERDMIKNSEGHLKAGAAPPATKAQIESVLAVMMRKFRPGAPYVKLPDSVVRDQIRFEQIAQKMTPEEMMASLSPKVK